MNNPTLISYMQQRVNEVCAQPEREWMRDIPLLQDCYDYSSSSYENIGFSTIKCGHRTLEQKPDKSSMKTNPCFDTHTLSFSGHSAYC